MDSEAAKPPAGVGAWLRDRWAGQSAVLRPGVAAAALDDFERRYAVRLPLEMRSYLRLVDGQDDMDPAMYVQFWPLHAIKTVREELTSEIPAGADVASWFVFADFLLSSHSYVIRLGGDPHAAAPVGLCSGMPPPGRSFPVIASSFEEFVDLYLTNSPRLQDPWCGPGTRLGRGP
jgi:hypothetical protein